MKTNRVKNDPTDREEIDLLHKLIEVADYSNRSRTELLFRLGFVTGWRWLYKLNSYFFSAIDKYVSIIVLPTIILAIIAAIFKQLQLSILCSALAAITAYFSWLRNQRSKNFDDALRRKDIANSMIIQNKSILMPYAGNVFDIDAQYAAENLSSDDKVSIDMYVFTEIDNLEFIFEKSRARLIEDTYVVRAIKIFVVRSENLGFFNVALRLINTGRYNNDFVCAAKDLLFVGDWHSKRSEILE